MIFKVVLVLFSVSLISQAQQSGPDLRAEIARIDLRHYQNLDDYLFRCRKVRVLLPSLFAFHKQEGDRLKFLSAKYQDKPQLVELGNFLAALNAQDKAGLILLQQEIDLALQMNKLPLRKRQAFFSERIRPVEALEDRAAALEIQMARDGMKRGLPLPSDIEDSLKQSH